jgi:hypothetical protein
VGANLAASDIVVGNHCGELSDSEASQMGSRTDREDAVGDSYYLVASELVAAKSDLPEQDVLLAH